MNGAVRSISLLLVSLITLLPVRAIHAQSVATNPVGYNMFSLYAGSNLRVNTFVQPTAFQNTMSSFTGGSNSVVTVSSSGSALTSGSYNETGTEPSYYMEVLSGSATGLILDIISNTASTVTVNANLSNLSVSGTESICIRPHTTLGSLFPAGCGLTVNVDSLKLFPAGASTSGSTFTFGSSGWFNGAGNQNNQIIYPGQGFILVVQSAETVSVTGAVKPGPTIVPLYAGTINLVGTINPMVSGTQTLSNYDFPDAFAVNVDTVKIFEDNGSLKQQGVYESNGANMFNGSGDADSTTVNPSNSVLVSVQQNKYWTMPSFYTSGD